MEERANTVYCLVKKYLELVGLEENKKGYYHIFDTCLTTLLVKGVDIVTLSALAGHKSLDVTPNIPIYKSNQIREANNKKLTSERKKKKKLTDCWAIILFIIVVVIATNPDKMGDSFQDGMGAS